MSKKLLPIILTFIVALALRLILLSAFPSGLNADEAALGYNAYSLSETGRDEHGNFMPVNLESFGDFKPALYSYLLIPLIKVFGLTEFVVRFPSAVFGSLSVVFLYLLVRSLATDKRTAFLSALFLTISPWHIHFSRGAWEVNVATTFIVAGSLSFIRWTKKSHSYNLWGAIFLFSASMYTYQSARVIAPLLGLGLALIYKKNLLQNFNSLVRAAVLLVVLLTPLGISLVLSDAASRVGGVGLLADEGPLNFVKELRGDHSGADSFVGKLLHNRPVIYSIQFVKNYLSHFDGNFLFINGDVIERNLVPETGLLYFTDFFLILIGFAMLSKKLSSLSRLTFLWLFIAPVASALTFQVPHALRAQNMVIPLIILAASGAAAVFDKIQALNFRHLRYICYLLFVICYLYQFSRYLHQYYVHYPKAYPAAWEYGFRELTSYLKENKSRYNQVFVTDKYDQPYILLLFYLQYPPVDFQSHHELTVRDKYNFSTVKEFSQYSFTNTSWDKVRDVHGTLIVAAPEDIPEVGVNIVKTIYFPGGEPAFKIISN
jgi:4-amino-4-deoxy-L-arabinose transferase-like glycosyltransferase